MKKIIAIGGGEIGRPGYQIETEKIDREIIHQTGKKHPKVLFLPTASSDHPLYWQTFKNYYGKKLGCKVEVLNLIKEKPSVKNIKNKILSADLIYVGGGNTLKMMNTWKKFQVNKILRIAWQKGIVMSGVSAGSICWFKYGNSDSRKFTSNSKKSIRVSGLNFINALHCPHYDTEKHRPKDLKLMMRKTPGVAIALDNCCALEVIDDKFRILKSKPTAKAYKIFWENNKYFKEIIPCQKEYGNLNLLLSK